MARGIIVTNQTELSDNGYGGLLVGINPQAIKRSLPLASVYWDKIKIVADPIVPVLVSGAVGELMAAGVLEVWKPPISDGPIDEAIQTEMLKATLFAPYEVFEESNQREPGMWSFLPLSEVFTIPRSKAIASRAIEMCLYSKLPTPSASTPIDKILNFKAKRDAELGTFRDRMDDLYQAVISSPDGGAALNSAAEKIDRAVADVFKSMNERFETKILSRFTVSVPVGAVAGALAGHAVAGSPGAALGALAGSIGLQLRAANVPRGSSPGAPFAYIAGVIEDVL